MTELSERNAWQAETQPDTSSLLEDFCTSFANAAVREPLRGLAQISDRSGLTDISASLRPDEPQHQARLYSSSWHAQTAGSALGSLVPFLLVQKGLRSGFGPSTSTNTILTRGAAIGLSIGEAAATGFVADFLTRPASSAAANDFWNQRTINGGSGALNFATLAAGSIALGSAAESSYIKGTRLASACKDPIINGVISSIPAGILTAEIEAQRNHGRFASLEELALSVYAASYTGLVLGAKHKITDRKSAEPLPEAQSKPSKLDNVAEFTSSVVSVEDAKAFCGLRHNFASKRDTVALMTGRSPEAQWIGTLLMDIDCTIQPEAITPELVNDLHYAFYLHQGRNRAGRRCEPLYRQMPADARDAAMLGLRSVAEALNFVRLECGKLPVPLTKETGRLAQFPEAQRASKQELVHMYHHLLALGPGVDGNPFAGANVSACAKLWELNPSMPAKLAEEAAALPPLKQLAAAVAWTKSGNHTESADPATSASAQSRREQHYRALLAELPAEARQLVCELQHPGALPRAVDALHGELPADCKQALVQAVTFIDEPFRLIAGIDSAHFQGALETVLDGRTKNWSTLAAKTAIGLASTFNGSYCYWLQLQEAFGRTAIESSCWLPLHPKEDLRGLSAVLFASAGKSPESQQDLWTVARNWKFMPAEVRNQPFDVMKAWAYSQITFR